MMYNVGQITNLPLEMDLEVDEQDEEAVDDVAAVDSDDDEVEVIEPEDPMKGIEPAPLETAITHASPNLVIRVVEPMVIVTSNLSDTLDHRYTIEHNNDLEDQNDLEEQNYSQDQSGRIDEDIGADPADYMDEPIINEAVDEVDIEENPIIKEEIEEEDVKPNIDHKKNPVIEPLRSEPAKEISSNSSTSPEEQTVVNSSTPQEEQTKKNSSSAEAESIPDSSTSKAETSLNKTVNTENTISVQVHDVIDISEEETTEDRLTIRPIIKRERLTDDIVIEPRKTPRTVKAKETSPNSSKTQDQTQNSSAAETDSILKQRLSDPSIAMAGATLNDTVNSESINKAKEHDVIDITEEDDEEEKDKERSVTVQPVIKQERLPDIPVTESNQNCTPAEINSSSTIVQPTIIREQQKTDGTTQKAPISIKQELVRVKMEYASANKKRHEKSEEFIIGDYDYPSDDENNIENGENSLHRMTFNQDGLQARTDILNGMYNFDHALDDCRIENCVDCGKLNMLMVPQFTSLDGRATYTCPVCNKLYSLKNSLHKHMLIHTEKYKCQVCLKSFCSNQGLQMHVKGHSATESPGYSCTICSKICKSYRSLRQHMRGIHEERKLFQCTICEKGFYRYEYLKNHMDLHSGQPKYQCPVCKKAYVLLGTLRKHMIMHTDKYKCQICSKTFSSGKILKMHVDGHYKPVLQNGNVPVMQMQYSNPYNNIQYPIMTQYESSLGVHHLSS